MVYRLRLHTDTDGRVLLRLGAGWRIFFILITLVLITAMIRDGGPRGFLPVLALISLFASIYHEQWVFDRRNDEVLGCVGVLFARRTKVYRYSFLRRIRVRSSAPQPAEIGPSRGAQLRLRPRGYVQLVLEFEPDRAGEQDGTLPPGGGRTVVQTESLGNRDHVIGLAQALSNATGIPLEV